MQTHGYSGTPLDQKLGLKPARTLAVLGPMPNDLPLPAPCDGQADVVLIFTYWRADLETALPEALQRRAPKGSLWVCWPKKAAKVPTDLTEDVLRDLILPLGLVDNKVCAIDATWSGLRFVERVRKRPQAILAPEVTY